MGHSCGPSCTAIPHRYLTMDNASQYIDNEEDLGMDFSKSLFSKKYKITDIRSDAAQWNKDWEDILHNLASQEVFSTLKVFWEPREGEDDGMESLRAGFLPTIEKRLREVQNTIASTWEAMEEQGHFETAWLLLPEKDRKRFLLKAVEGALRQTSISHDARALCPEISIRALLKENGKVYVDFIKDFGGHATDQKIYHLPSEWWNQAAREPANEPEPGYVFTRLTVQRAEFIGIPDGIIYLLIALTLSSPKVTSY